MSKLISIFIPSFETGGVENNVILYSKILIENGYKVDVVYTRANDKKLQLINDKVNKVKIKSILNFPFVHPRVIDSLNIVVEYYKYLKKNKENILVISFQNSIVSILLCRLLGIKVIARVANHPNIVNVDGTLMTKISNFLKNYIYRYATLVITNSQITSKQIAINTKANTKTIYNPSFSNKIVEMSNEQIDDERFLNIKAKKIISVGRLVNQKNFELLIRAFKVVLESIDAHLIIIGEGEKRDKLVKQIEELNLSNKVYLAGFKINPHNYVKNSDLFVLSSLYEGLPNSLIEAIAVDTPAIATNCLSGPSEILLDGEGGDLVEVGNVEQLSKSIIKNLSDREYSKAKQKIAFEHLNRFSYDEVKKDILDLVESYE
ncbi:glycosyltransferase [Aliarcobacter butzleri]|uniref:glycosyltransferase n=1 Tax=Aliarcobacter butzleri TaxID=28197 RepID=UPI001EDAD00F|nr:glycosyltransferase [Aliarcobacter butzleri]